MKNICGVLDCPFDASRQFKLRGLVYADGKPLDAFVGLCFTHWQALAAGPLANSMEQEDKQRLIKCPECNAVGNWFHFPECSKYKPAPTEFVNFKVIKRIGRQFHSVSEYHAWLREDDSKGKQ